MSETPDFTPMPSNQPGYVALHEPFVIDEGTWALHDVACAVCWTEKAVLDMNSRTFGPCWQCQKDGWSLVGPPHGVRRVFAFIASGGYSELRRW